MNASLHTVTAFDAKNRLGRLLDRVAAGEELVITRHGEPVARLVPINSRTDDSVNVALATFRAVRASLAAAGTKVSRDEIQSWKRQGRR
ncbi:MAG: type II toxin-antitoxin system prevent-host-death family antitoxin [Planctomycetota bacterium]